MSKEIKEAIKMLTEEIPQPNQDKKHSLIRYSKQLIVNQEAPNKVNIYHFCIQQLRYIRVRTWILQFLIVVLAGLCITNAPSTRALLALISAVGPLIYLVSASELVRSHVYRMQELELTTKYSYSSVLLARISIMNIINIFAITIIVFTVVKVSQIEMLQAFFFVCIPFLLTCAAGLFTLQHKQLNGSLHQVYISIGIAGFLIMLNIYFFPQLFLSISNGIWWGIFPIVLGIVLYQYRQLFISSTKLENKYA